MSLPLFQPKCIILKICPSFYHEMACNIVLLYFSDALIEITTDVFLNGYTAMAKMIAEITQMNFLKIVQNVTKKLISNVEMADAFQSMLYMVY